MGTTTGAIKGDTRSLDSSSYWGGDGISELFRLSHSVVSGPSQWHSHSRLAQDVEALNTIKPCKSRM